MNPYPFASLNHLTVPVAIEKTPPSTNSRTVDGRRCADQVLALWRSKRSRIKPNLAFSLVRGTPIALLAGCRPAEVGPDAPPADRRRTRLPVLACRPGAGCPSAGPKAPPGAAGPPRGRLREAPARRAVPLGRHLAQDRLRLFGPRLRRLPHDRQEGPALDLGPDGARRARPLPAATARRPGLHERRRPRRAGGLEASRDPGTAHGCAGELREPEVTAGRDGRRAAPAPVSGGYAAGRGEPERPLSLRRRVS